VTEASAAAAVAVPSIVLGSFLIAHAAVGQGGASVVVDVAECVSIVADDERFACYERRVAESTPPTSGASLDPPETGTLEERRSARDAERLQAREERAQRKATREDSPGAEETGFTSSITQLRETVPNAWLVALDNGEVWEQTDPKPYRLREGMQVRIYASAWGSSYRLTAPELNGFIRVRQKR
jgi:hypothetical protein